VPYKNLPPFMAALHSIAASRLLINSHYIDYQYIIDATSDDQLAKAQTEFSLTY
jgi:hypothetical protein